MFAYSVTQGRRPVGTGGDGPPKFEVGGTAHALHGPPNILRSSVVGCVRKDEQSKKWSY